MNKVVLVAAVIVTAMVLLNLPGASALRTSYAYIADFWLVGVIPVTLYFFYGGKIWCRYWCPLAKVMEYLSRAYSRLNIVSNDKCITCGLCSRFCQVGIDVMAFAKNQAPFSNLNTACIHCGICITVCPMDVLQFDTSGSDQRACATGHCSKAAIAQTA